VLESRTATEACMPYEITRSYLPPGRGSISRHYPGLYSIYPPIKERSLSRPETTPANDLPPESPQKCRLYQVSAVRQQSLVLIAQVVFLLQRGHTQTQEVIAAVDPRFGYIHTYVYTYIYNAHSGQTRGLNLKCGRSLGGKKGTC